MSSRSLVLMRWNRRSPKGLMNGWAFLQKCLRTGGIGGLAWTLGKEHFRGCGYWDSFFKTSTSNRLTAAFYFIPISGFDDQLNGGRKVYHVRSKILSIRCTN